MPVPLILNTLAGNFYRIPYAPETFFFLLRTVPWLLALAIVKRFFSGANTRAERNMHSKVVLMTGGTSGIGAAVARSLAERGAQLVLLVQSPLSDPFLIDYIMDLREATGNELISAERVDLASLHSVRSFATKWIDNAPPRRLDMVVLCASALTPQGKQVETSDDGVEIAWAVNYLANFHLLSILSPAIRAQPPDRDVRVILGSCGSYSAAPHIEIEKLAIPIIAGLGGVTDTGLAKAKRGTKEGQVEGNIFKKPLAEVGVEAAKSKRKALVMANPGLAYASSKLALMTFAQAFQKHLNSYVRPDKQAMSARVILVDPGRTRTPGMRRYLTRGTLLGLLTYLVTWPFWWLILKSPDQGAQSFLHAAMEAEYGRGQGGWLIRECQEEKSRRHEISDEEWQKKLWEVSEKAIEALEKEGARKRATEKKERETEEERRRKLEEVEREKRRKEEEKGLKKEGSRRDRKDKDKK